MSALFLLLVSALVLDGEVHGFRIEVPEGWSAVEQDRGEEGFVLTLLPPGSSGQEGVSVRVVPWEEEGGAESLLEKALGRIEQGGEEFSQLEERRDEIADRETSGVSVRYDGSEGEYRIVQSYLVEGATGYVLQRHAPVEAFDAQAAAFEEVIATFGFVEVSGAALAERRLADLAARCGSEIDWAEDWDEAARRARAEGRLILVATFLIPGFAITDTPRTSLFVDEDVIELVNERFVPFWYERGMETPIVERYGMSRTTFGQALLLATPEGEVVLETRAASNADVAYPFLLEGLARSPQLRGTPVPADLAPLDRAERHAARGELARAMELLDGEESGRAHRLRARILRLERRGEEALAALAKAREAGGEPELALLVEEAEILMREGRDGEAAAALDRVIAEHPDGEVAAEASLLRGVLDLRGRDRESAERRWRALAEQRPKSRFAWQAAAALRSTVLDLDVRPDFGWPDETILSELLSFPEPAPLPTSRAQEAAEGALAWLLAAQRPDGSWPSPSEISTTEEMGPEPFVDAMTALAGRAILGHRWEEGCEEAARRALGFLLGSIAQREETPPLVFFMDYMTWSDACMLDFLADALETGLAERESLLPAAGSLVSDLAARQQGGGGWSYYVTSDLDGAGAPAQSISFTTAAAILALAHAREVGFPVPDEVLDPAVSALERMRDDDGIFVYFLYHATGTAPAATAAPGAVGRGPACELALLRAGGSSPERVRRALDLFLGRAPLFSAEQGKVLMHAGPDGQGCHYLFFDYAHAAFAQSTLPADGRTETRLLELVLTCRQPDGSFLDTPILGRAYGSAMALLAFDSLSPAADR